MNTVATPVIQALQLAFEAQTPSQRQLSAFANFLEQGLPTTRLDAWKYTDLRRFATKRFQLPKPATTAVSSGLLPFPAHIVFVDGQLQSPHSLPSKVNCTFEPIACADTSSVFAGIDGAFERLNAAFAATRCVIRIADDTAVEQPIYLVQIWSERQQNAMTHPRTEISVGRNSRAVLIEHHLGANCGSNFGNSMLHVGVGEGASLEHMRIQDDASGNFNIENLSVDVAANGTYSGYQVVFGGGLARTDLAVDLRGRGARAELRGLIFARDTQHLDVRTVIHHHAPDTTSSEEYRGIADQRGRVVFNGKVIVAEDAQHTDAAQSSRNLLLSPHAEIDTRPELEIYANDVKCAHGATVGQLDSAALFYLQSRGIDADTARATLIHAFAMEIIDRIPLSSVREHVLNRFMQRIQTQAS